MSKITSRGLELLRQHPHRIDISVLVQFDEFRRFRQGQPTTVGDGSGAQKLERAVAVETPEEAYQLGLLALDALLGLALLRVAGRCRAATGPRRRRTRPTPS